MDCPCRAARQAVVSAGKGRGGGIPRLGEGPGGVGEKILCRVNCVKLKDRTLVFCPMAAVF
jgi:hypothetical protein